VRLVRNAFNTLGRKNGEQDVNFSKIQAVKVKCKANTTVLIREEY